MDYQYVTTDTSVLKKFRGLGTGREILMNADPDGRIVIIHEPSKKELKEATKEYNLIRVQNWWDNVIMSVCTDKQQSAHPRQKAPFANGFRAFIRTNYESSDFNYLKITELKKYLPESCPKKIVEYCISLPLETQLTILKKLRPIKGNDLIQIIKRSVISENVLPFDFLECLSLTGSARPFLNTLVQLLYGKEEGNPSFRKGSRDHGLPRLLEFLGWLNQKKWLLLNKKAVLSLRYTSEIRRYFNISGTLGHQAYWNTDSLKLAEEVIKELRQAYKKASEDSIKNAFMRLCLLLRSTTIESIGDFSPELLTFNESYLEIPLGGRDARVTIRQLTDSIIRSYKKDQKYSNIEFPIIKRTLIGHPIVEGAKKLLRSKGYRWILKAHPEFIKWVELFEEYTNYVKLQWAEHLYSNLNRWFDYLSEIENPPLIPEDVNRAKHIRNVSNQSVNTYWAYLIRVVTHPQSRGAVFGVLRRFFDYYQDKLILNHQGRPAHAPQFINPIKSDDKWNYKNRRKTHRYAIGAELLELLREIILDRDKDGIPTFGWAKNHPAFINDWIYEVEPETKETIKVWWPGRAIAMYVLLTVPLRSFQVRWLDEGLADEYVYDFDRQCLIRNSHPCAEVGRQEGVFRLVRDTFHGSSFLGLWVNTNKTKMYDPTGIRGYEIPWPNDELFSLLRMMITWNNKYFPNPTPVTLADDSEYGITTEAAKPFLPQFYILFRDKTGIRGRNPNLPVNYDKLTRIWGYLLAEAENRLKARGKHVELVTEKVITNSLNYTYKVPQPKYDLHSLRVSGITSLLEKGVPVHIVSEYIAGHSTIIMTLYYEKTSPYKVREMLRQAQNDVEADLDGCLMLLDQMDDPESILVWNNLDYQEDYALQALKANKGLWQVDMAGICPGTLCAEGGPLDGAGNATSVPAGACGLCRFYVTGPAFLYGQMQKLNNLMYSMREKGEELVGLRRKAYDLEVGGSKRSLVETQGRRDRIGRELKDVLHEWCNRYRMFHASLALLDQYQEKKGKGAKGSKSLIPLLTANTQDGFKPIVKEATNIGLVRQISLMSEILGNFDLHKGPLVEYEEILNTILVNNGFEALLVTIPKEKRVAAANLLGEFLINSIGDDAIDKLSDGGSLPQALQEQTRGLLEYLKSDKFVIDSLISTSESQIPQQYVQIKGLKS